MASKTFDFEFEFGDMVVLKTDLEIIPGMITRYIIEPNGAVSYEVSTGCEKSWHNAIELQLVEVEPIKGKKPEKVKVTGLGGKG